MNKSFWIVLAVNVDRPVKIDRKFCGFHFMNIISFELKEIVSGQ
jgi:hypothetical protein